MRTSKLLSALLLVGTLTLSAPGVASAHAEGRANCRYAMQHTSVFSLASLGRVQQTFAGALTGVVTTLEELDRSVDRAMGGLRERVVAGVSRVAAQSAQTVRTTTDLGTWGGPRLHTPR